DRVVHVPPAHQVHQQPRLPRRDACVAVRSLESHDRSSVTVPPLPCTQGRGRGRGASSSLEEEPLTLTLSPEYRGEGTRIYAGAPGVAALRPLWPRNMRVGENSPSLCPTMSSCTNTFRNLLPLWTSK